MVILQNQSLSLKSKESSIVGSIRWLLQNTRRCIMITAMAIVLVVVVIVNPYYKDVVTTEPYVDRSNKNNRNNSVNRKPSSESDAVTLTTKTKPTNDAAVTTTTTGTTNTETDPHDSIHIVFSTGCTAFQDWQSYVVFYQIYKVQQMGHVTRIVSGCHPDQKEQQERNFHTFIRNGIPTGRDRFHIFFPTTPTNPEHSEYKFFNKPFGLYDWIQTALQMPSSLLTSNYNHNKYSDTMFIIIDPDQVLLRPFVSRNFNTPQTQWHSPQQSPPVNSFFSLLQSKQPNENTVDDTYLLRDGNPMAQAYGMGAQWIETINTHMEWVMDVAYNATLNDEDIFMDPKRIKQNAYLHTWTQEGVLDYYVAGPPYVLSAFDMYRIVKLWAAVAVTVYEVCEKEFLSEMYAYIVAAAYLNLPHQISSNFMVSSYDSAYEYEGWENIDRLEPEQVCPKELLLTNTSAVYDSIVHHDYYENLPYVLHYCQEYYHGSYYFFKHFVPDAIMSCEHSLFSDPNDYAPNNNDDPEQHPDTSNFVLAYPQAKFLTFMTQTTQLTFVEQQRQVFMMCHLIPRMNDAFIYWKNQYCTTDDAEQVANYNRTYIFSH